MTGHPVNVLVIMLSWIRSVVLELIGAMFGERLINTVSNQC